MAKGKHPVWYAFVRWAVKVFYFGTHGGLTVLNRDRVPMKGGLIVAPNHVSYLDPPIIACSTRRRLRFMAKEELFEHWLFGPLISSLGAFPVRRGESDTEAMRRSMALLEEGEAVLVFPEGTRGDGETMLPINRGVAMLAKRTNANVIPAAIVGTHIVLPRGKKGEKHRMVVAYGTPFTYAEVATGSTERENRELFARELERRILELCHRNGLPLRSAEPSKSQPSDPGPAGTLETRSSEGEEARSQS